MKIEYIYEAGVFGSYKKTNAQSNIDNAKKELARNASLQVLERQCDELAELYLNMLNEVNSQINVISITYNYKLVSGRIGKSNLLELSNCIANNYYRFKEKDMRLSLIKNVYCNRRAIDYMISHGCFILPLVDTTPMRGWTFFDDPTEIISYKNMIKTVTDTADKVIKSHLSKFPSYTYAIPNKVQIVIVRNVFNSDFNASYRSDQEKQLFSYMGITDKGVEFKYPVGQGSSCLNYILDNFAWLRVCNMKPVKSDEPIWKAMVDPSPLIFNKFVFSRINTNMSEVSADNFYGIKLLKFACDKGLLLNENNSFGIDIFINNVIKNKQYAKRLKQAVSNNGLDNFVTYSFRDKTKLGYLNKDSVYTVAVIGKEITSEKAEQEGILIDNLKRRVYEFDYKDTAEVESATKNIINACDKFFTGADDSIIQIVEDKLKKFLLGFMIKILTSKPNCIGYSNKILLCDYLSDYNKYSEGKAIEQNNVRVIIDPDKIQFNKRGNLTFYIDFDFKFPVRGVNPKYNQNDIGYKAPGKNYESISSKIKIEIPL